MIKLISITPDAEKVIAHCARVSSDNQDNPNYDKLLKYCIKNAHWSIFEQANMCLEIITSRAISGQIIRHRSFTFQEFSQRYAKAQSFQTYEARRQDNKNRQNSIDDMSYEDKKWFFDAQKEVQELSEKFYNEGLEKGIAKEQMRMLLPMATTTKLYMNGTIRSWINYIQVRTDPSTQLEHRLIAEECKKILIKELPIIAKALEWI